MSMCESFVKTAYYARSMEAAHKAPAGKRFIERGKVFPTVRRFPAI